MELRTFKELNPDSEDLKKMPIPLQALLIDYIGDWDSAHYLVQNDVSQDAAWVHAYLHRKEGDHGNANYWYRNAGRKFYTGRLEDEWTSISLELLDKA